MSAEDYRTVHHRVPKTSDVEIHISTLETTLGTYTDIREYVKSLHRYGRGITFPQRLVSEIHDGLEQAMPDA